MWTKLPGDNLVDFQTGVSYRDESVSILWGEDIKICVQKGWRGECGRVRLRLGSLLGSQDRELVRGASSEEYVGGHAKSVELESTGLELVLESWS